MTAPGRLPPLRTDPLCQHQFRSWKEDGCCPRRGCIEARIGGHVGVFGAQQAEGRRQESLDRLEGRQPGPGGFPEGF